MAVALRTPRLLLREWRDADRRQFTAICSDPQVMRYFYQPPADRVACDAWIDRMRHHNDEHGFAYWAVELPGEAELIGGIGLSRLRHAGFPFAPTVEIGWRLAPAHWGRGCAFEAAHAVLDDGFGRLGLDEIVAFTVPANGRSWRLMERLGMSRDAAEDFDHPAVPEGDPLRRHALYRLRR